MKKPKKLPLYLLIALVTIALVTLSIWMYVRYTTETEQSDTQNTVLTICLCASLASVFVCMIAYIIFLERHKQQELSILHTLELNQLVAIIKIKVKTMELVYANDRLYEIIGVSKKVLTEYYSNNVRSLLGEEQYEKLHRLTRAAIKDGSLYIKTDLHLHIGKNDSIWLHTRGTLQKEGDWYYMTGCAIDIGSEKRSQEELKLSLDSFETASSMVGNSIFTLDIATHSLKYIGNASKVLNAEKELSNVPYSLVEQKRIHPDDLAEYVEAFEAIYRGEPQSKVQIRMYGDNGKVTWCNLHLKSIYDIQGNAVRAIGVSENVTLSKTREAYLLERAETDSMTGVLNHATSKRRVESSITAKEELAFILLDLDHFKRYNDVHGHLEGDSRIKSLASAFCMAVGDKGVVGRLGGDEFMILLRTQDREQISRVIEEVNARVADINDARSDRLAVTVSQGVALLPKDGMTFERLYANADRAMYDAKAKGKNTYGFYSQE